MQLEVDKRRDDMKLGIIGGLGPLATAYYYELLTRMSDVRYDQEHLEIFIHSCPQIPDRTEYILDHHKDNPIDGLINAAQGLQSQGANILALPCTTAHYFYDELSQAVHIPMIHLINEVCDYLMRKSISCVGIMATTGTIVTELFQKELEKREIRYILPNQSSQKDIMHLIYHNIKCGEPIEMERFEKVSEELFHQGAQTIILGCTELSLIKKEEHLDKRYLDVLELLAAVALFKCHMNIKDDYRYLIDEGD